MHITDLELANFRNFARLRLGLAPGMSVFVGANAQGKTNLLEAIFFLATTRSPRTTADRELIRWGALEEEVPFCRLAARVQRGGRPLHVQIALGLRRVAAPPAEPLTPLPSPGAHVQKRIRVDGAECRALDLIGRVNVSLFTAQDIQLVAGEPALRRRYLDMLNSQVDPRYLRELQHYQRVLWQRNHLLRLIAERRAGPEELIFWDQELVRSGAYLVVRRQGTVSALARLLGELHPDLSGRERLVLVYRPSIGRFEGDGEGEAAQAFRQALELSRRRERGQGLTVVGPHRDDLAFLVEGRDMGPFGSRGQQRTIVLSLKLAEAQFMAATTGERPVVLLDDVLSELDATRRRQLLAVVLSYEQVLITATDLELFPPELLQGAALFQVKEGRVEPVAA